MEYIKKYATEDQITQNLQYKETVGDKYFDKHGVLQPGHANKFEVHHFSLLALMEWGQQNPFAKKEMYKKHRLRFITNTTIFGYEVQTLVSMMHWDNLNKQIKLLMINRSLKKKGTTFEELQKKTIEMGLERDRLFMAAFKRGMRSGSEFHAAVRIQYWWLRNHRKHRIYKNIYQLMDEYAVPGGFTGQDSANYFGVGSHFAQKSKNLLKIQEDIIKKVEMRRITCRKISNSFLNATCGAIAARRDFFAKNALFNITHGLAPTIYGFGSSTCWADHDEPYYCEPCATRDLSYPGDGRSSDSLNNPRWAAQCSKCGKQNPFYPGPFCDEGPSGYEGPASSI